MKEEILSKIETIRGHLDQLQDELNLQDSDTRHAEYLANGLRYEAKKLEDMVELFHFESKNNEA